MNLSTRTDSDVENRPVFAKGERWGGKSWEFGVSRYKLLNTGQIIQRISNRSYHPAQGTVSHVG